MIDELQVLVTTVKRVELVPVIVTTPVAREP
jgi:hypothetical protein